MSARADGGASHSAGATGAVTRSTVTWRGWGTRARRARTGRAAPRASATPAEGASRGERGPRRRRVLSCRASHPRRSPYPHRVPRVIASGLREGKRSRHGPDRVGGHAMANKGFRIADSDMPVLQPADLWLNYIDTPFKAPT